MSTPNLISQVQTDLEGAQLSGSDIFTKVFPSYEDVPAEAFYSLPSAVIGYDDGTPDEENPELGTESLTVDCYVKDYAHAGKDQLVGDTGAQAIIDYLRESYSYKAGDNYMVGMRLTSITTPVKLEAQKRNKKYGIWTFRATYEVERG